MCRNTNNMCNKYISFIESHNYSNFLRENHIQSSYICIFGVIFDLSGLPPSGNIGNTLSILTSLLHLRNMRKQELRASLYFSLVFNYLCQDIKGCQRDIIKYYVPLTIYVRILKGCHRDIIFYYVPLTRDG